MKYVFSKRKDAKDCYQSVTIALAFLLSGSGTLARAGSGPVLEFDTPFVVSCRSISSTTAVKKAGHDLIEVKVPITARLLSGSEKDIKQCVYTLVDPSEPGTLSVLDWLPRTELKTEFAKPIQFNKERTAKIGINISGHYVITATGDATGQVKSGVAYELLPPQEIVLASGTIRQGHGVYFKLKPSNQTTLEGMKLFSAIYAVPHGWRGGCLELQCEAARSDRGIISVFDRQAESSTAVFCLALYLAGDGEAERQADRVATCEQRLFNSLAEHKRELTTASAWIRWYDRLFGSPWGLSKLRRLEDTVSSRKAELLTAALDQTTAATLNQELPKPVSAALGNLQEAVQAIRRLSGEQKKVAKPAGSQVHATIDFADPDPEPSRPQSKLRDDSFKSVAKGQSKRDSITPARGHAISAETRSGSGVIPNREPLLRSGTAGPAQSVGSPHESSEGKSIPAPSPQSPTTPNQLTQDSTLKVWYFIVSIWGAVFTSVLAPLVVDILRQRLKGRRQHRSKATRTSLPCTEHGSYIPAVPESSRLVKRGGTTLAIDLRRSPQCLGDSSERVEGDA